MDRHREADRQMIGIRTDRQADRQTDRQTGREAGRLVGSTFWGPEGPAMSIV